jgi:predicted kinase
MIYCLVGIPGSGKSTLARMIARYFNAVVINNDSLREMLFGYTPEEIKNYWGREDISSLEKQVSTYRDTLIKKTLEEGKTVLLDNTHVKISYINDLKKYNTLIKFIPVEVDLEVAIERDAARTRSVGKEGIEKFYKDFQNLKKTFDFKDYIPEEPAFVPNHNYLLESAYIFDIDGTLALNTSGRSPYDYDRVLEDTPNDPVIQTAHLLSEHFPIIVCSGRPERSRVDTEKWLSDNGIFHNGLYMRKDGDNRKDFIVKEELWRDILKKYNIVAMYDDRTQVVDHARKLGFTVFQVDKGNF